MLKSIKNALTQKIVSQIFLPATAILILIASSRALFSLAQSVLIEKIAAVDVSRIPFLQVSTIFPQIIVVATLLLISKSKPFEKVFQGTLIAIIGCVSLLAGGLFLQEYLQMNGIADILGIWPTSLLFIALNFLNFNLFSVLVWGFINRYTTVLEGMIYYIALAFVIGLLEGVAKSLGMFRMHELSLMPMLVFAIALLASALILFNWSWKRISPNLYPQEEPLSVSLARFPVLSCAYLLAGAGVIAKLMDISFKNWVKMGFSEAVAYSKFMGNYSLSTGIAILVTSILWAAIGSWLILKKGWRTTALFGAGSILVGGLAFLSYSAAIQSIPWLSQSIFTGLLMSTSGALFFPLIQIAYLYMPIHSRFRAKIATEMIALPLMKSLPSLLTQGHIIIFGSMSSFSSYQNILILLLLVLLVFASRRISFKLREGFSSFSM